jgi:dihydroorotate dehydrogenase electron transfer subunit
MSNTECVQKKVLTGKIMSKTQVTDGHFMMGIFCPYIAQNAKPGQFILVRVSKSYDPLLSRPLAVYRSKGDIFEIMFKVVGKGTGLLSEKNIGETIGIVGPLGKCFPMDDDFQIAIFVAGGMGIAALMSLAEAFKTRRVVAIIGASTSNKVLGDKDFVSLGAEVHIATEDGSSGYKGKVSELLEEILLKNGFISCRIFACGPVPMLKAVYQIANRYNISTYVSLEERMACGVGACMGCVCRVNSPADEIIYKTVCVDGPVFDARELVWK